MVSGGLPLTSAITVADPGAQLEVLRDLKLKQFEVRVGKWGRCPFK